MPELKKLFTKLKRHYGEPALPPATGAYELVLWENCCYLLSDERRAAVFEGLKQQVGLEPQNILSADRELLLVLAKMGGMRPETRGFGRSRERHVLCGGTEGVEAVSEYRRSRRGKDSAVLRCRGGAAARLER